MSCAFSAMIFTIMPEMFPGTLQYSLAGSALKNKKWDLDIKNIRDYGIGKHRAVDDTPAGGGAGMVMRADVLSAALDASLDNDDMRPRYFLSPRGERFTQQKAHEFSKLSGIVLICGRFEGVDERIFKARNIEELSIGDYILSGGELAAQVVLDAIIRLIPGVMGSDSSEVEESFENGLLEYPQYTRPRILEGQEIPSVLLSGNHQLIKEWREEKSQEITKLRRADLWGKWNSKISI